MEGEMDDHYATWLCSGINELAGVMAAVASRPSVLFRPKVYLDGDSWCALYGDNIQDGVCGFGDSPAEAVAAFDAAWSGR